MKYLRLRKTSLSSRGNSILRRLSPWFIIFAAICTAWFMRHSSKTATSIHLSAGSDIAPQSESKPSEFSTSRASSTLVTRSATTLGCGVSWSGSAISNQNELEKWQSTANLDREKAHQLVEQALLNSSEPEKHAAGLLLEQSHLGVAFVCEEGEAEEKCADIRQRYSRAMGIPAIELAAMARNTKSAAIFSWAMFACTKAMRETDTPAACMSLSADRWAQLAPDNAWPWLKLAGQLQQRGDFAGEETAMFRASLSSDWGHEGGKLSSMIADNIPNSVQGMSRLGVLDEAALIAVSIDTSNANTGVLRAYCAAPEDANRQQVCARLADHLLTGATDLLSLSIGVRIGDYAGLPSARMEAARNERDALTNKFAILSGMNARNPVENCPGLSQAIQFSLRRAEVGELTALRERQREIQAHRLTNG